MKHSLVLTALLAATPLALLLPGCSGGAAGLGSLFPTPTPKPATTATATPQSSATPIPNVTPTSPPTGATVNLTFTPSSGATFASSSPLRATLTRSTLLNSLFVNVTSANPQASDALLLTTNVNATAGATTNLADLVSAGITSGTYINNFFQNAPRFFAPQSGSVTLTAISATSATVTFRNAVLVANEGSLARGTVTINGTVSGPYVTQ